MSTGAWIVIVAVVLALGFGGFRLLTDGRFRGTHRVRTPHSADSASPPVEATPWDAVVAALPGSTLGEKATLLQISSAFCAPCRVTRRTLAEVSELVPGIEHLEVDAELGSV